MTRWHRHTLGIIFLILGPTANMAWTKPATPQPPTMPQLWQQYTSCQLRSSWGSWRNEKTWRRVTCYQILQRIVQSAPPDSVDWVRAKLLLVEDFTPGGKVEQSAARAKVVAQVRKLIKNKPDSKDVPLMVHLVHHSFRNDSDRYFAVDLQAVFKDYLQQCWKKQGPNCVEAGYWFLKDFELGIVKEDNPIFQQMLKQHPDNPYTQLLLRDVYAYRGKNPAIQEIQQLAQKAKDPRIKCLLLGHASYCIEDPSKNPANSKISGNQRSFQKLLKSFQLINAREEKYRELCLFPFADNHHRFTLRVSRRHRLTKEQLFQLEDELARNYALATRLYPQYTFSRLFQSGRLKNKAEQKAFVDRVLQKAVALAKPARKPRLELVRARYYWNSFDNHKSKQIPESMKICQAVLEKYPTSPWAGSALDFLALASKARGDQEQAKRYWRQLLKSYPQHSLAPTIRYELAVVDLGSQTQAQAFARLANNPKEHPVIQVLAKAQQARIDQEQGNYNKALALHQECVKHWPGRCVMLVVASELRYSNQGRSPQDRLARYETSAQNIEKWSPYQQGNFQDMLLWDKIKESKDDAERRTLLKKLVENHPKSPRRFDALLGLGFLQELQGEKTSALKNYRRVIQEKAGPFETLLARIGILRLGDFSNTPIEKLTAKQQERAQSLAKGLTARRFQDRVASAKNLKALGPAYRPFLHQLSKSNDPTIQLAAKEILKSHVHQALLDALELYKQETKNLGDTSALAQSMASLRSQAWRRGAAEAKEYLDVLDHKSHPMWYFTDAQFEMIDPNGQVQRVLIYGNCPWNKHCAYMTETQMARCWAFCGLHMVPKDYFFKWERKITESPRFEEAPKAIDLFGQESLKKVFVGSDLIKNHQGPLLPIAGPPIFFDSVIVSAVEPSLAKIKFMYAWGLGSTSLLHPKQGYMEFKKKKKGWVSNDAPLP